MAELPETISVTEELGVGVGMITAPEMTQSEAETEATEIATFRKSIDWHNPAVCIDGRCCKRADGEEGLPLGAHVAGGAQSLLVSAKSVGLELGSGDVLAFAKERGFTLGAHCDTTNKEKGFSEGTGCGANDKIDLITQQFTENKDGIGGLLASLMGEDFDTDVFSRTALISPSNDKNALINAVGPELTETLEDDGQGVHGHREQMVIFNYEENTTIDRDAYFRATGKQAFIVDVWYIRKLATELASGEDAANLYHAMMAYQVATYIGLCDGTHRAALLTKDMANLAA